jgi:DNA-binding MarR family transcriptional regulator
VLVTLQREGLVARHPHPTHGRILQVVLTDEGRRRLDASSPAVRELEATIEAGFTPEQVEAVKEWLVSAARRAAAARSAQARAG